MKPNAYTKLYAHCIFTPRGRTSILKEPNRTTIHKYIYGAVKGLKCNPIAINGMEDHIHILVGFIPTITISDLVRDIKRSSALYVNSNHLFPHNFSWQDGYGAFTVGYRELDKVYHYVLNQEEHHSRETSRQEYLRILVEEGIDYNSDHIFEFYDGN